MNKNVMGMCESKPGGQPKLILLYIQGELALSDGKQCSWGRQVMAVARAILTRCGSEITFMAGNHTSSNLGENHFTRPRQLPSVPVKR